jgi:hypothetical protein
MGMAEHRMIAGNGNKLCGEEGMGMVAAGNGNELCGEEGMGMTAYPLLP